MFLGNRLGTGRTRTLGEFSPSDIANQVLWLDASDSVSLGNPSLDDPISSWLDLSVAGNDVEQLTALEQPLYKSSGFGTSNLPYLSFDGVNDIFENFSISSAEGWTSFFVYKRNDLTKAVAALGSLTGAADPTTVFSSASSAEYYVFGRNGFQLTTDGALNNLDAHIITSKDDAGIQTGRTDLVDNTFGTKVPISRTTAFVSLGTYKAGAYGGQDVAEVLHYSRALTSDEIDSVESYLKTKWGTV